MLTPFIGVFRVPVICHKDTLPLLLLNEQSWEGNTIGPSEGNVDAKSQKDFIRFLIRRLRETIEELYAYRVAAGIAEDQGFAFAATLENALGHPTIKSRAEEQLEGLEGLIDDDADSTDERIKEFLRNWKPGGAPI